MMVLIIKVGLRLILTRAQPRGPLNERMYELITVLGGARYGSMGLRQGTT